MSHSKGSPSRFVTQYVNGAMSTYLLSREQSKPVVKLAIEEFVADKTV